MAECSFRRGKWSDVGVPHKGWECLGVTDLGEDPEEWETCEMCEEQEIRFMHTMSHPDYPGLLDCGSVCAGHMEGDYAAAKKREQQARGRAQTRQRRRARWLDPASWKESAKGNSYRKERGFVATVFRKQGGWGALIQHPETGYRHFSRTTYATEEAAKAAALRAYETLRERFVKQRGEYED